MGRGVRTPSSPFRLSEAFVMVLEEEEEEAREEEEEFDLDWKHSSNPHELN